VLIDTHAHLASPRLAGEIAAVLERARAAGVEHIVAPATTAEDAGEVVRLAQGHPAMISGAVAIHPNDGAEAKPGDWERIAALAGEPGIVAIGETGLDGYWDRTPFALQQELFDRHLDLARRRDLPVIIHCRDCYPAVIAQLERQGGPTRGVLHSFTGTADDARALLALGLHLSFAGMITFNNKALDPLRAVAAEAPADRILVETDSPYLSPHPFRGKPNEPARVALTAAKLAELRGIALEELAFQTSANARRLFCLSTSS
jgi:TatD DNase family protein